MHRITAQPINGIGDNALHRPLAECDAEEGQARTFPKLCATVGFTIDMLLVDLVALGYRVLPAPRFLGVERGALFFLCDRTHTAVDGDLWRRSGRRTILLALHSSLLCVYTLRLRCRMGRAGSPLPCPVPYSASSSRLHMPMFSASRKQRALARVSAIRAKRGRTFLLTLSGVASPDSAKVRPSANVATACASVRSAATVIKSAVRLTSPRACASASKPANWTNGLPRMSTMNWGAMSVEAVGSVCGPSAAGDGCVLAGVPVADS